MKKILFFIFILVFCPHCSYAQTWVHVDQYNYIDKDSIKTYINDYGDYDYTKKTFWLKSIDTQKYKDINKKVDYCLVLYIINYQKQLITVKASFAYDKDGKIVLSETFSDHQLNWDAIVPGSFGEKWAELVQKPRLLKKMYKLENNY